MKYFLLNLLIGLLSMQAMAFSWKRAKAADFSLGEHVVFYQAKAADAKYPYIAISKLESLLLLYHQDNHQVFLFPYDIYDEYRNKEVSYCNGQSCVEVAWQDPMMRINGLLYTPMEKTTSHLKQLNDWKKVYFDDLLNKSIKSLAKSDLTEFA